MASTAAVAGLFVLYLAVSAPVMDREEMQKHFDAARRYLTSASPERLALGQRYLDALAEIPAVPLELETEEDWIHAEKCAEGREKWLASGREALAKLRALAAEGAGALAPRIGTAVDTDIMAVISSVRLGVLLLCVDMVHGAAVRDDMRVRDDLSAVLSICETIEHRGMALPRLVCARILRVMTCGEIVRLRASFGETAIRALIQTLARVEERLEPLQDLFWGEIAMAQHTLEQRAPPGVPGVLNRAAIREAGDRVRRLLGLMHVAARPPHEAAREFAQVWQRFLDEEIARSKWRLIRQNREWEPEHLYGVYTAMVDDLAALRGTRIVLGLELYAREHKEYPETLAELVPGCIAELPHDPFTDKDLRYARRGASYVLYSVGRDIEDNGGKAARRPGSEPQILVPDEDYVIFGPPPDVQSITPGARLKSSKPKSPPMRPRT